MISTIRSSGPSVAGLASRPRRRGVACAHSRRWILLLAVPAILGGPGAALAQIDIDSFTSATPQATPPNSEVAAAVIGGFRDVKSNNASNIASADGGRFRCAGTAAFQGCTVQ